MVLDEVWVSAVQQADLLVAYELFRQRKFQLMEKFFLIGLVEFGVKINCTFGFVDGTASRLICLYLSDFFLLIEHFSNRLELVYVDELGVLSSSTHTYSSYLFSYLNLLVFLP